MKIPTAKITMAAARKSGLGSRETFIVKSLLSLVINFGVETARLRFSCGLHSELLDERWLLFFLALGVSSEELFNAWLQFRSKFNSPFEVRYCFGNSSLLFTGQPAVHISHRVLGIEPNRLVVIINRAGEISRSLPDRAANVVGHSVSRVAGNRMIQISRGAYQVSHGTTRGAAVYVSRNEVWIEHNSLVEVAHSASQILHLFPRNAAIVVSERGAGIQRNRFVVVLESPSEVTL